jgi:predicted nucleic acid-binding protein
VRVYVDSSALLKRVLVEGESEALKTSLSGHARQQAALVSSSLAWVEVSRALRACLVGNSGADVDALSARALAGILERPISAEVLALARRLQPAVLRSLDAIHLASAILLDVDLIVAYDQRLAEAARHHGMKVSSPSSL